MRLLSRIRQAVERPIQRRFQAAVPQGRGDQVLIALLKRALAVPGVGERVFGEAEAFLVKSALFLTGVRLDASAHEGVGTRWKEDLGQRHYDPDAGACGGARPLPQALLLPHGLYLPLVFDPQSPFVLRRDGGVLRLHLGDLPLFPVEFEARPRYYERTTSGGAPMRLVGVHRLERQVLVEYGSYCRFFADGTACLFCGITAERAPLRPRHGGCFAASPAEVAEVVEAACAEGVATEMQATGGVLPRRAEVDYLLDVGRAMQERLGVATVRGSQAVLCPPSLEEIDALRAAGWEGVAFNLEIWDERLWPGFVPGKAALMPRAGWLLALEHAAQAFGKGKVASVLVAGLEPKRSLLEGVAWLAERGIYGVPIPWAPAPGSALEGHQTPTAAWHFDVLARVLDVWEAHGLPAERHSSGGLPYADLARMRAGVRRDEAAGARRAGPDLRRTLAFEGRVPDLA